MRIFKRGMAQGTPVAKNVSVTELLIRGDAARATDSNTAKAPGGRIEVIELNAVSKEAAKGPSGPAA